MSALPSVPTGKVIKNYLDEYGISQKELSARTGVSEKHLSHLLNGSSRLTEELALKLEKVLPGVPASYWLNYETKYREALAREKASLQTFSSDELQNLSIRFRFKEVFQGLTWDLQRQANEMLSLLKISDYANFEKTYSNLVVPDRSHLESIVIWLNVCRETAELQDEEITESFDPKTFRTLLPELKEIAMNEDAAFSLANAKKWLNNKGVYLVIQEAITNCKVRGALTYYRKKPAIFLSLRFKTHDHAWFALAHEIGHLLLHPNGKETSLTFEDDMATPSSLQEEEANSLFDGQLQLGRLMEMNEEISKVSLL
ncbi:MAG: helix-turn-helix domain-containing protein [Sphaerochaeta sp.]|nr:helix-turn-helix domain-containing protein [Sphaerochaeta sp.]